MSSFEFERPGIGPWQSDPKRAFSSDMAPSDPFFPHGQSSAKDWARGGEELSTRGDRRLPSTHAQPKPPRLDPESQVQQSLRILQPGMLTPLGLPDVSDTIKALRDAGLFDARWAKSEPAPAPEAVEASDPHPQVTEPSQEREDHTAKRLARFHAIRQDFAGRYADFANLPYQSDESIAALKAIDSEVKERCVQALLLVTEDEVLETLALFELDEQHLIDCQIGLLEKFDVEALPASGAEGSADERLKERKAVLARALKSCYHWALHKVPEPAERKFASVFSALAAYLSCLTDEFQSMADFRLAQFYRPHELKVWRRWKRQLIEEVRDKLGFLQEILPAGHEYEIARVLAIIIDHPQLTSESKIGAATETEGELTPLSELQDHAEKSTSSDGLIPFGQLIQNLVDRGMWNDPTQRPAEPVPELAPTKSKQLLKFREACARCRRPYDRHKELLEGRLMGSRHVLARVESFQATIMTAALGCIHELAAHGEIRDALTRFDLDPEKLLRHFLTGIEEELELIAPEAEESTYPSVEVDTAARQERINQLTQSLFGDEIEIEQVFGPHKPWQTYREIGLPFIQGLRGLLQMNDVDELTTLAILRIITAHPAEAREWDQSDA